jgi:hypothetical protein
MKLCSVGSAPGALCMWGRPRSSNADSQCMIDDLFHQMAVSPNRRCTCAALTSSLDNASSNQGLKKRTQACSAAWALLTLNTRPSAHSQLISLQCRHMCICRQVSRFLYKSCGVWHNGFGKSVTWFQHHSRSVTCLCLQPAMHSCTAP